MSEKAKIAAHEKEIRNIQNKIKFCKGIVFFLVACTLLVCLLMVFWSAGIYELLFIFSCPLVILPLVGLTHVVGTKMRKWSAKEVELKGALNALIHPPLSCPHCGKQLPGGTAKFCSYCGNKLQP